MTSAIRSTGRRGSTIVPNWRWEDQTLDPFELRIAGWLASHADGYLAETVTRNEIARRTGVSQGKVSSSLTTLAQLGVIAIESVEIPQAEGGRRLVITVDFDVWEAQEARPPHDRVPVTTRPGPGHDMTTSVQQVEDQGGRTRDNAALDFELFWKRYPRKVGKPEAERQFRAALRRATFTAIAFGLERHLPAWQRSERRFIPHPATWLRRDGWNDEVAAPARTNGRAPGGVQQTVDMGRRIMAEMERDQRAIGGE